jgi:hypothetical protein
MADEIGHLEWVAVRRFAEGLQDCFKEKINSTHNEGQRSTLHYALSIVRLHLQLAELDFEAFAQKQERYFQGKKTLDKNKKQV